MNFVQNIVDRIVDFGINGISYITREYDNMGKEKNNIFN